MKTDNLRILLPGAVLLATLGLAACDGGDNAQGAGGIEEEGGGAGAGMYQDEAAPATQSPYDTTQQEMDTQQRQSDIDAGAGGISDDQTMGTGTGDTWDRDATGSEAQDQGQPQQDTMQAAEPAQNQSDLQRQQ